MFYFFMLLSYILHFFMFEINSFWTLSLLALHIVALLLCFHSLDVTLSLVSTFSSFVVFRLHCVMFLTVCIVPYTLFSRLHTK